MTVTEVDGDGARFMAAVQEVTAGPVTSSGLAFHEDVSARCSGGFMVTFRCPPGSWRIGDRILVTAARVAGS